MVDLEKRVEDLERQRQKMLINLMVASILWNGLRILMTYVDFSGHVVLGTTVLSGSILGMVWFIWVFIKMFRAGNRIKNRNMMMEILGDELFQFNRNRAFKTALIAVIMTQAIFITLGAFGISVPGILVAEINVLILISSCLGSFVFFQSRNE